MSRVFTSRTYNSLGSLARSHHSFHGHFISVFLKSLPEVSVKALCVFPEDHKVHIFCGLVLQRTKFVSEQMNRSEINIQIQLETKPQQDLACMRVVRDA